MDHTLLQKSRIYSSKKLLPVVDFGRSSRTVLLAKLWLTVTASDLENNLATAIPEGTSLVSSGDRAQPGVISQKNGLVKQKPEVVVIVVFWAHCDCLLFCALEILLLTYLLTSG